MPIHHSVLGLHFNLPGRTAAPCDSSHTPATTLTLFSENCLGLIQKQFSVIHSQFTSPQNHTTKPGKAIMCLQRNVRSSRKTLLQNILKH